MDDARIGRALRALRQRRGMRQSEIAAAAGVAQSTISEIESGRLRSLPLGTLRRVFAAVDAGFEATVLWRGAGLDRLIDARHASLVGASVDRLAPFGWETHVEASYSIYGERGSIDVLGGLARVRAVLVEEIKSELANLEETIRKLDEKVRLVRQEIAFGSFRVAAGDRRTAPRPTRLDGRSAAGRGPRQCPSDRATRSRRGDPALATRAVCAPGWGVVSAGYRPQRS